MPRRTRPDSPGSAEKWARISAHLRGGRLPVDPVRAPWDTTTFEESGVVFAYRNFKLNRYEYAYGRIPEAYLADYAPQEGSDGDEPRSQLVQAEPT